MVDEHHPLHRHRITALRYPEKELVSVPAVRTSCEPAKPFLDEDVWAPALTAQQQHDDVLDMKDVLGTRIITTRLHRTVTVREENAVAALEVMSRCAANPKWLVYLPPTMSPCETAPSGPLLEHPAQAFAYYRREGVPKVICEEKHMGSRAVLFWSASRCGAARWPNEPGSGGVTCVGRGLASS